MTRAARAVALVMAVVGCSGRDTAPKGAVSLIAVGDSQYTRGAFDSAGATFQRALNLPAVRQSPNEGRLLTRLAMVAYRDNDYATARRLGDSSLALKTRHQLGPGELAESRNVLGLIAWDEGRLGDAKPLFEQAIAEYVRADDKAGIAKASSNLANIAIEYGQFAEAKQRFAAARETARQIGNRRIEGRVTTNLAMLELWFGDPHRTVSLVADARRLAREANDPVNEENALGQLALAWAALGEPGAAIAAIDTALVVAKQHELQSQEANDLVVAAGIYASAGALDRALGNYTEARRIYEALELPIEVATVLRHESNVRALRGAHARSRDGLMRALATHRENDARFESFLDRLSLARLETEAKDLKASARWLEEAERDTAALDGPYIRVMSTLERARWHDERGDARAVLTTVRAITPELAIGDAQSAIEADWLLTRSYAALRQLDSAAASARRAAVAIELTARGFSSMSLRVSYVAERHRMISDIVLTLLRAGLSDEAFRIAESARGQALRARLARMRTAVGSAVNATSAAAVAERERLLREIDALVAKLAEIQQEPRSERGVEWPKQNTDLTRRIRETRTAYEALVTRQLEGEAEPRQRMLVDAPAVDVPAVRAALAEGEAIVEYYPTPDTLVVFVLTRGRMQALRIPATSEAIEHRVRLVRGLVGLPGRGAASRPALEGLYTLLVQPLAEKALLVGVRQILFVPHGALSYLPYAALRNPRTGRVLAEDYVLERLPAAALLPVLRAADAASPPVRRTAVFAPFPDRLPATRAEADSLSRIAPNVPVYRGGAATEAQLRRELGTQGLVHVASHATFNGANPMFSGIELARGRGDSNDDGRFELHEVLELPVRSALVFLSGCETALGGARATAFDRPEDAATLSDAFLLSGAGGVVATLWRIDDEGAAYFAERFYRHVMTRDPAEALVMAQRELIGHPRWGDPYYWAPYSLNGDGVRSARDG